jgi:NAD(P)-dependent dehydrogenase (short-subunit alcohol dehydrogenase family)
MTTQKVVLITGASRGIGETTARAFHAAGWTVAAGMRAPAASSLSPDERMKPYALDVTDDASVTAAVAAVMADFGRIDVLVNNAGLCLVGPLEELSKADDRALLETNLLGPMALIRAVLPHMRAQGGGRIINVSSMCGGMTLPLYSGYCASKWGLEGLSESLAFELRQHNIKIKIVQPSVHRTGSFETQLAHRARRAPHPAYMGFFDRVLPNIEKWERTADDATPVARTILKAATDRLPRLRYPVGSGPILFGRRLVPSALYVRVVRRILNAW